MYRKFNLLPIVVLLLIALSAFAVAAQDATLVPTLDPAAQPTTDPAAGIQPTAQPATQQGTTLAQPEFIGDPNQESVQIVISYLQTRDPNLLAENAEFFDLTTGQPTVGRDPITQMQNDFFGQAFTGTLVQPVRVIAAENGWVVMEFNFSGTHTGTFRNQPATNLPVSVPMVGIFRVENGQIVQARLYYDAATINQQLGMTAAAGAVPADQTQAGDNAGLATGDTATTGQTGAAGQQGQTGAVTAATSQNLDAVLDTPEQFYGQSITVEGNLTEFVNERMVRLTDDDLIGADSLLVLHHMDGGLDAAIDENTRVQVTGTVRPFVLADFESEFGIDLDDSLFVGFENQPVLVADSITPVQ